MSRPRILLHGVATGLLVGVLTGIGDAVTTGHEYLGRSFLWIAVIDWVLCWLIGGLLLGLAAAAVVDPARVKGPRSAAAVSAFLTAAALTFSIAFLALVYINVVHLPSDTSTQALLADALVLGAALVLAAALARLLAGAFRRRSLLRAALASVAGPALCAAVALAVAAAAWRGGLSDVSAPSSRAGDDSPNVIVILIDTLRRDHLSGEGYSRPTSPEIDRLARSGTRFPNFVSQSCYTKPAVASLLTSLYPSGHRVGHLRTVLGHDFDTLPELFHRGGYRTAMICSNTVIGAEFGFAQGAELFYTLATELTPKTRLGYVLYRLTERGRELAPFPQLLRALKGIEHRFFKGRNAEVLGLDGSEVCEAFNDWRSGIGDDPYFAYLHFMEPHAPYAAPGEHARRFAAPGEATMAQHPPTVGLFLPYQKAAPLPEEGRRELIRAYDGEIAYLDGILGGLFDRLREEDGRKTLIAITADHGEEFYEHGGWGHGQSLYEELLEVPFIVAGPGVPAGRNVPHVAQLIDIAPTLLELAGIAPPEEMMGRSLVPLLRAAEADALPPPGEPEVLTEIIYGESYFARALRRGEWKLIVSRLGEDEREQLYNLGEDPQETDDRSAREAATADALRERLTELVLAARSGEHVEQMRELDPVTRERLKALGYID